MNEKIIKLVNRDRLTNKEFFLFLKMLYDIAYDFFLSLNDGGERPGELDLKSDQKALLSEKLSIFKENIDLYETILNLPRKFVETEEMTTINRLRLLDFSTVKKKIYSTYENDKSNLDAQNLWYLIRIYKYMGRLKIVAIHTNMLKFVADMESDTYKASCTALNITDMITSIKNKNVKFEELLSKRSSNINKNYKSIYPCRKMSEEYYLMIYDVISSIINLNTTDDYSDFISKINGHTYYYNNMSYIKKTRSKNKNNNEERPGDLTTNPKSETDEATAGLNYPVPASDPDKKKV